MRHMALLLLYGSECLDCSRINDGCLKRSWNYVYWKLFKINSSSIAEVYSAIDMLAIEECYRRGKFRLKMSISSNTVIRYLLDVV